jgi:predicted dehydrogenase
MPKTIGIIGYKGHALRLAQIFQAMEGWGIACVYHPSKAVDLTQSPAESLRSVRFTQDFKDLLSCDAVVIASPNQTHFAYLTQLAQSYKGYVFCEKPPAATLEELNALEQLPAAFKERLYFNFNMRTSWLRDQMEHIRMNYKMGEPVLASVVVGYGFAFKEAYQSSWRSKKEFPELGVLETMGIHYLDFLSLFYGAPTRGFYYAHKHSTLGEAKDTCHLSCLLGEKCVLSLCCSYAVPFVNRFEIHLTDGRVVCDNGDLKVFAPRNTFAPDGSFVSPPLKYQAQKSWDEIYPDSLRLSCVYFAKRVEDNKLFDLNLFNQSLLSNRACLSPKSL